MKIKLPYDDKVMTEQLKLAQANEHDAHREMKNFRRFLQDKYGYEVKVEKVAAGIQPKTSTVWDQNPPVNYHSVVLADCPPGAPIRSARLMEPYIYGQALMKIDIECAAHVAGVRKSYLIRAGTAMDLRTLCEPWVHEEIVNGANEQQVRKVVSSAAVAFSASINSYPMKMLVNMELRRRFPILRPVQFVRENLWELHGFDDPAKATLPTPLALPLKALHAANRLFVDEVLFEGATNYFAPHCGTDVGDLAQKLFEAAKARLTDTAPGCHYKLMDQFAKIVGFPDLIAWEDRPRHEYLAEAASLN